MNLNEAIYKIRSKEKMFKPEFFVGEGDTQEYLEGLIVSALNTTRNELNRLAREGYITKAESKEIHKELSLMPKMEIDGKTAVATFPLYKSNELWICAAAVEIK